MVLLKYVTTFQRTFEKSTINCEIFLQLKQFKNCLLPAGTTANQNPEFKITDTKLYFPAVILSTQDNIKLLKQLGSGFKRPIIGIKIYLKKQIN